MLTKRTNEFISNMKMSRNIQKSHYSKKEIYENFFANQIIHNLAQKKAAHFYVSGR